MLRIEEAAIDAKQGLLWNKITAHAHAEFAKS